MRVRPLKRPHTKAYFTLNNEERVNRSIARHPYNRSVSITHLAEDTVIVPESQYYKCTLHLSRFIKDLKGLKLTGLSIDHSYCVHEGVLTLDLDRDTYFRFGIDGKAGTYKVVIDLTSITPKLLSRLEQSFKTLPESTWLFTTPHESFEPLENRIVTTSARVTVPTSYSLEDENMELLNHLALITIPIVSDVDPFVSVYNVSGPLKDVVTTTITGYITPSLIQTIRSQCRTWWCLQIRGFEETPWSWKGVDHVHGGDCHITILQGQSLLLWELTPDAL